MREESPIDGEQAPPEDPIAALNKSVRQVVESGRSYAEAEITRQKLRAMVVAKGARDISIMMVLALLLVPGFIVALLVGLILGLAPILTIWGATGAVVGGTLLVILCLLLGAKLRLGRMKREAEL